MLIDDQSSLGNYISIFSNVKIVNSLIGDYSYIQEGTSLFNISIGKFCSIAQGVTIGLAKHPTQFISTSPVFYDNSQPLTKFFCNSNLFPNNVPHTEIGHDVWIGNNAQIMSGLKIGNGAIIGAGSIVTKDVEPYSVIVGAPGKVIKKRFDDHTIKLLEESLWWNQDEQLICSLSHLFSKPELFAKEITNA